MATETLGLAEIIESQSAKYATHNQALREIEGRTVRVKSRTTTAQPGSPAAGDTYILPTGATGTNWAGNDGKIAHYYGGSWKFWTPVEGVRVWVNDEDHRVVYNGSAWVLDTRAAMLTKSVAGGSNVTLTAAENSYPAIDCTGALTANIALIVTTTPKFFLIRNSTSGAYTLTVKTSAGTGVIVSQGTRALLFCDGTNVVSVSGTAGNPQGDRKESCRVATTANITLSGTQTIDSVSVVAGDRVLVKDQSTASENGIYVCAAGAWSRAADADTSDKVTAGMFTVVTEGGVAPDTLWVLTTNDPITLGSTSLTFAQLSGGGGGTFLALSDTPGSFSSESLKLVRVNAGETALEFVDPIDDFLALTDTPSAYTGHADKTVVVKGDETGIDFATPTSSALPVDDTTELVRDPADNSKKVRIDAGAVATSTTRTILMPDNDVDLGLVGSAGSASGLVENLEISTSRAGNAETIALKTSAGTDPSASDKIRIGFRDATAGSGAYSVLEISSATSITVSSGSTLGATSATPFRVWLVGFNDGGTFRLGVIKCALSDGVYGLQDNVLASSTAEGGAGAADSSGVIYTGTAVTSKAMRVLGYLEYTLTTAGTWDTAPSLVQVYDKGVRLPGAVLQTRTTTTGEVATTTTTIPLDDTVPQNTEGGEFMTRSITPVSATSMLRVMHHGTYNGSTNYHIICALFRDSTAGALSATVFSSEGARYGVVPVSVEVSAASTAATTFKVRAGMSVAGTLTFNGSGGSRNLGGVMGSFLRVEEIAT